MSRHSGPWMSSWKKRNIRDLCVLLKRKTWSPTRQSPGPPLWAAVLCLPHQGSQDWCPRQLAEAHSRLRQDQYRTAFQCLGFHRQHRKVGTTMSEDRHHTAPVGKQSGGSAGEKSFQLQKRRPLKRTHQEDVEDKPTALKKKLSSCVYKTEGGEEKGMVWQGGDLESSSRGCRKQTSQHQSWAPSPSSLLPQDLHLTPPPSQLRSRGPHLQPCQPWTPHPSPALPQPHAPFYQWLPSCPRKEISNLCCRTLEPSRWWSAQSFQAETPSELSFPLGVLIPNHSAPIIISICLMSDREANGKGERERYIHLNAEFQRIARRDKKAFLRGQSKELEENNRMGKTRDLFKKIRDTKGIFPAKMGSIKDRNGMDLKEAEDIKKR